jgi:hypothetical protein
VFARKECQRRSCSEPGQIGKQNPSSGQQHRKLAETEPNGFHLRCDYQRWHLEQEPDDEIGEEDTDRPGRRDPQKEPNTAK